MRQRSLLMTAAVLLASSGVVSLNGQTTAKPGGAAAKSNYTAPKTGDGQPDLQGVWDFRTVTPLERPAEFKDKPFLTEQEAAEYEKKQVAANDADANRDKTATARRQVNGTEETGDVRLAYNNFWWDRGTKAVGTLATSLIYDPPDGKIPALTPAGRDRAEALRIQSERSAWGPEDRSTGERCILGFNAGPPMNPGGYNMNVQVFQNKDYVVLLNEMVHNARVVPLDNRPRTNLRQWSGESRGHWDGNTLVVETVGFYDRTSLVNSSPSTKVVERFTRVAPDVLMYDYTVSDPTTWTKPYSAQVPMSKNPLPIYEYACHEGNYGMFGLLSGARAVDNKVDAAKGGSR
jgi:hypothetical protein